MIFTLHSNLIRASAVFCHCHAVFLCGRDVLFHFYVRLSSFSFLLVVFSIILLYTYVCVKSENALFSL